MGGLLAEPEALLADVQHQLGQTLLTNAAYDALDVHLAEAEVVDGSSVLVHVVPAAGKVVVDYGWQLKQMLIVR